MQIEWITVAAQLINFLVLVWLLNRFLFRPVLEVMTRREAMIDQELQAASERMTEAESIRQQHQSAINKLESEKTAILATATENAETEEKRLLDNARIDVDKRHDTWLASLETEKRELTDRFRQSIGSATCSVSDTMLRRISNRSLTEQMVDSFIDQLDALDPAAKAKLAAGNGKLSQITIMSAEPLDSNIRRSLTRSVHQELEIDSDIDYQVNEQLIAGLKLTGNGFDLNWHLSDMLKTVDGELSSALDIGDATSR